MDLEKLKEVQEKLLKESHRYINYKKNKQLITKLNVSRDTSFRQCQQTSIVTQAFVYIAIFRNKVMIHIKLSKQRIN